MKRSEKAPPIETVAALRTGRTTANGSSVDLTTVERVQAMVLGWYAAHARHFVWRVPNPDPYVVLVSETMLQQTQTARVQERLPSFLQQFPDFTALAAANNATIVRAWQGMGYNNRALRLRDCARAVVDRFAGKLPDTADDLRSLPGLGPYTVSAILSFAFHRDVIVLDVNVQRLYSRLFLNLQTTLDVMPEAQLLQVATEVYPRGRSSEWHQACMDIAAEFCTARSPRCLFCPIAKACHSAFGLAEAAPPHVSEPSYRGKPNRIWRGRIIELLRDLGPDQTMALAELRNRLFVTEEEPDVPWLENILRALERDGLIEREQATDRIRLHS
ncbi:A/G-specific adenine glycosylase [bacterium]|nr:A/G-specific adenine glycosylase [bacterium]